MMQVEVVYIDPGTEFIEKVEVSNLATVEEAVIASKLLEQCAQVSLNKNTVGIFGKQVRLDTVLNHGDRVEIYCSLIKDPMEARRLRAAKTKSSN